MPAIETRSAFRKSGQVVLVSAALLALAGCVVEPYDPYPPAAPVAASPYYGCCYSYYDYPPPYYGYYGGPAYYGPSVGFSYNAGWSGHGRGGYHHWH